MHSNDALGNGLLITDGVEVYTHHLVLSLHDS